jgi:dihydroorotate dehydrogenase (fumarate)
MELAHPVIVSASPFTRSLDGIRRLEDAGAAAIVMHSLFEEQIRTHDQPREWSGAEAEPAFGSPPAQGDEDPGPEEYLDLLRRAKESVGIPVIASLNGVTDEGWTSYARSIQETGVDAIELNIFHIPADLRTTGRQVEQRYADVVFAVRSAVSIPLAVKIGPYFSALGEMARRLVVSGADGLVLFNRFYQPDFDLDTLEVVTDLELSHRSEIRLPLLWIAALHGRIPASLAASTGVQTAAEVVKYLLAGADVVMTTSALLRQGTEHLPRLVEGLRYWLDRHEYDAVATMQGILSQEKIEDPTSQDRANYLKILQSYRGPFRR